MHTEFIARFSLRNHTFRLTRVVHMISGQTFSVCCASFRWNWARMLNSTLRPGISGIHLLSKVTLKSSYYRYTPHSFSIISNLNLCAQTRTIMSTASYPAISTDESTYRPFLLSPIPGAEKNADGVPAVDKEDWVSELELDAVKKLAAGVEGGRKLKLLVLYGSLRERSAYCCLLFVFHF
jgi:hypothetical protein